MALEMPLTPGFAALSDSRQGCYWGSGTHVLDPPCYPKCEEPQSRLTDRGQYFAADQDPAGPQKSIVARPNDLSDLADRYLAKNLR